MLSYVRTGDVHSDRFAEVVGFSVLHCKVTRFPFVNNRHFVGDTLRTRVFVLECYVTNYPPPFSGFKILITSYAQFPWARSSGAAPLDGSGLGSLQWSLQSSEGFLGLEGPCQVISLTGSWLEASTIHGVGTGASPEGSYSRLMTWPLTWPDEEHKVGTTQLCGSSRRSAMSTVSSWSTGQP